MDDTSKTQKENESYGKWEQGASLALRQWGSEHQLLLLLLLLFFIIITVY